LLATLPLKQKLRAIMWVTCLLDSPTRQYAGFLFDTGYKWFAGAQSSQKSKERMLSQPRIKK
jgi:hypothetical protein